MGLTIHYEMKTKSDDIETVRGMVQKMRQMALDLPFEQVGDVMELSGSDCDYEARRSELKIDENKDESLFWMLIQAAKYMGYPWNKNISRAVSPTRIIAFDVLPGLGCEDANFGLCIYPKEVKWEYDPKDDQHFQDRDGRFDWQKWKRRCRKHLPGCVYGPLPDDFRETLMVEIKPTGWQWSSFCETQYASATQCGGITNFLRCHISVITLLERMAKMSDLEVNIRDEGQYGPGRQEAHKEGRKPTYRRHKGKHSPAELVKEIGEWNEMMAAVAGSLGDALSKQGFGLEAAIKAFQNFEQLEFRGRNKKFLEPFLKALKTIR